VNTAAIIGELAQEEEKNSINYGLF
jgi:hypothetical protein